MVKVGEWVIIRGLGERHNWHEGEVRKIKKHPTHTMCEVAVIVDGKEVIWDIAPRYLKKIKKHVDYTPLIDWVIDRGDKEWFNQLNERIKQL